MALDKKTKRLRRARRARSRIRTLGIPRLTVYRSGQHLYAQVISVDNAVIAAANTLQKGVCDGLDSTRNKAAATAVGKAIAEKSVAAGVKQVAFDRSGYKYHGRVKQLAEAARESGLEF